MAIDEGLGDVGHHLKAPPPTANAFTMALTLNTRDWMAQAFGTRHLVERRILGQDGPTGASGTQRSSSGRLGGKRFPGAPG